MSANTPGTIRRRPKPLTNRGTPVRPNPRPPPPKRQMPGGSSEREPGCRSTAKPGGRSHTRRWRPGARCAGTRTTANSPNAPPKRAARDLEAQQPLQAAAPATHPTATKVDDLRGDHRDVTAALSLPAGSSSTCGRCWSEIIGRSAPRSPEGARQPHSRRATTAANRERRTDARQRPHETPEGGSSSRPTRPRRGVRQDDLPNRRTGGRLLSG